MLITDLSNVKSIQIVEREKLESLLKEIELGEGKFIDPNTAQKLGKGLGAGYMLTGSYLIMGETMRIDARLVDVGTGEISMAEEITGAKNTFFTLEKDLVNKLVATLDLELSRSEERRIKKVQTESFEAFNAYSSAIDALDNEEYEESKKLLEKATNLDEEYDIAWDKLDEVESFLLSIIETREVKKFREYQNTLLPTNLIKIIDNVSSGDEEDCMKFVEIYNEWSDVLFRYSEVDYDTTEIKTFWEHIYLLPREPVNYEDGIVMLGQKLYQFYMLGNYLLSKEYSDTYCGGGIENPNLVVLNNISIVLYYYFDSYIGEFNQSLSQCNIPMYDQGGKIVYRVNDYPTLIWKHISDLIERFPDVDVDNDFYKAVLPIIRDNIEMPYWADIYAWLTENEIFYSSQSKRKDYWVSTKRRSSNTAIYSDPYRYDSMTDAEFLSAFNKDEIKQLKIEDSYSKILASESHLWIDALHLGNPKIENHKERYTGIFIEFLLKPYYVQIDTLEQEEKNKPNYVSPQTRFLDRDENDTKIFWYLPRAIKDIPSLEIIKLKLTSFSLPPWIGEVKNLRFLDISGRGAGGQMYGIDPIYIDRLLALIRSAKRKNDAISIKYYESELKQWYLLVKKFNEKFSSTNYTNYKDKSFRKPLISVLPKEIGYLEKLELLDVSYNNIESIDENISNLKKLKYFILVGNPIINDSNKMQTLKELLPNTEIIVTNEYESSNYGNKDSRWYDPTLYWSMKRGYLSPEGKVIVGGSGPGGYRSDLFGKQKQGTNYISDIKSRYLFDYFKDRTDLDLVKKVKKFTDSYFSNIIEIRP